MPEYNDEQISDIRLREKQALDHLKNLNLSPACMPQLVNLGNDTFGIKLHPYLADTKYTPQKSPVQI